ncbi:hypothetical protein PP940_gp198 [Rhizobium phage RL2RES]|uniref:Uncharacterized protein n=1 Tax=Rhizobium phage RL2RES TaxID=103371 RepID=A0A6B9J7W7_9CAUD|nr:hypothetical protein PP940_gp198 [Rhizobium phage RL2RES]QGZ14341.1 hypothetical protein RL2RES_198 [Rhizobium phage RL2RES]
MALDYLNYLKDRGGTCNRLVDDEGHLCKDTVQQFNLCVEETENFQELKEVLLFFTDSSMLWEFG